MPIEAKRAVRRCARLGLHVLTHLWIAFPWTLLFWLGGVIALRRWSGLALTASLGASAGAATAGWRLVWQTGRRLHDAQLSDRLAKVEDATLISLFGLDAYPAFLIKAAHLTHCQRRWGVNARSSGWQRFRVSWLEALLLALGCATLTVHAWWLGM